MKSSTIRKAGAIVLSAALALSSLAVAAPEAQAAAKQKTAATKITPSKKKVSVKAGKSSAAIKLTLNKKATKKVTINVKSSNTKIAKVTKAKVTVKKGKKASATFKVKGVKAGSAKVTASLKNSKGKTIKATVKVTVTKTTTNDDDVVVSEGKITLVDQTGLQTDGTGIIGDTLRVDIPQSLGTADQILWYRDDTQLASTSLIGTSNSTNNNIDTTIPGKYYAVVITTKGTTYKSNTIELRDGEAQAVIKGFTIEDDYTDGSYVVYDSKDTNAVVSVTLNRLYAGTFKIYKKNDTKFASAVVEKATGGCAEVPAMPTAYDVLKGVKVSGVNSDSFSNAAVYASTQDGTATYKFKVPSALVRGTEYVVCFDQTSIGTDTPGSGTANAFATAATAPYVTAPAKIAITKVSNGNAPEVTFYDEKGGVLSWYAAPDGVATIALGGLDSFAIYGTKDKVAASKDAGTAVSTKGSIKKGVLTADAAANSNAYWLAEVKTTKGIFGAEQATLTSEPTKLAQDSATKMALLQDATTATTAVVTFENLRVNGKLYIVKSKGLKAAKTLATSEAEALKYEMDKFDADDPTTYEKAVDVKDGDKTASITDVIKKVNSDDSNKEFYAANTKSFTYTNAYAAIFIPEDETNYGRIRTAELATGGSNYGSNSTAPKDTTLNFYGTVIGQKFASYKLNSLISSGITVTGAAIIIKNATTGKDEVKYTGDAAASAIVFADQFGEEIADPAVDATLSLTGWTLKADNTALYPSASVVVKVDKNGIYTSITVDSDSLKKAGVTYSAKIGTQTIKVETIVIEKDAQLGGSEKVGDVAYKITIS